MGVEADRRRGLYRLPGWVNTLICIAAIVALYYAFQGINDLDAPAKVLPCGTINPTCAVRPASKTPSLPPTPRTTTPTTAQIVPLPPSNTPCPSGASCIPQPSFAPAP